MTPTTAERLDYYGFTNQTQSCSHENIHKNKLNKTLRYDFSDQPIGYTKQTVSTTSSPIIFIPIIDILYHQLKEEVKDLKNLKENFNEDSIVAIYPESIKYCLNFIEMLELNINNQKALPYVDAHPDGEASLVWQSKEVGVLTISFSSNGYIIYGGYFLDTPQKPKGKLHSTKKYELLKLIKRFE